MRAYELLNEYKATPSALAQMAKNIPATAGFEMEIVADVDTDQLGDPDFSEDVRVSDISDVQDFFESAYMDAHSMRYVVREMNSDYDDWLQTQLDAAWENANQFAVVRDYIDNEHTDEELRLMWRKEYFSEDREPTEYEYEEGISELLDKLTRDSIADNNDYLQAAYEDWRDYQSTRRQFSESAWFEDIGIDSASDAMSHYPDLVWPYYESSNGIDYEQIAHEIRRVTGRNATTYYIKGSYPENTYTVTGDCTIHNDEGDECGFELVSPPLSVAGMLEDYNKIRRWALGNNFSTNDTTGLHMNVSLENFDRSKVDYVKLALLLGEEYMAGLYNRFDIHHATSAVERLKMKAAANDTLVDQLLDDMRKGLTQSAIEELHNGWTDKYTSVNMHSGRVEFRFPGGYYLDKDPSLIAATLMRCVVVLDAACDPNKFRQEYLKKLYKLVQPYDDVSDDLHLFVAASMGQLPRNQFKMMLHDRRKERGIPQQKELDLGTNTTGRRQRRRGMFKRDEDA